MSATTNTTELPPHFQLQFVAPHGVGTVPGIALQVIARGDAVSALRQLQAVEFDHRNAVQAAGQDAVAARPEVKTLADDKVKHQAAVEALTPAQEHARQQRSKRDDAIRAGDAPAKIEALEAAVRDADARVESLQHRVAVLAEIVAKSRDAAKKEAAYVGKEVRNNAVASAEATVKAAEANLERAVSQAATDWLMARERYALVSNLSTDFAVE